MSRLASTRRAAGPILLELPAPRLASRTSLATALKRRQTTHSLSDRRLPLQTLSNLLWAAWGINRQHGPFGLVGRTAGSASNSQELDVYVLREEGAYRYDAAPHRLLPVCGGDLRTFAIGAGQRGAGAQAPVRLVYVADLERLEHTAGFKEPGLFDPAVQQAYVHVDTGLIAANVYLFAASVGLGAWFHNCDRDRLASKLHLRPRQRALFGQTIGFPALGAVEAPHAG